MTNGPENMTMIWRIGTIAPRRRRLRCCGRRWRHRRRSLMSQASLDLAAKRKLYRDLTQVDLQTLPLAIDDDCYDALICIGVMTYVSNSVEVLQEFTRMVRPKGRIIVTQRDDLFQERAFGDTIKAMADDGVIAPDFTISAPQPYLPDNPDFGSEIRVIYIEMTVT